jgi:hypothetical protein
MKRTFTKSAASAAALALIATPAFAAPGGQGMGGENAQGKGQLTSPAKLCKSASKKKVEGQKKSAFAACVSGAKKAQAEVKAAKQAEAEGSQPKPTKAPGQLCKGMSKKKVEGQNKSAFAMCVKGVNTARQQAKKAEQEAKKAEEQQETTQS